MIRATGHGTVGRRVGYVEDQTSIIGKQYSIKHHIASTASKAHWKSNMIRAEIGSVNRASECWSVVPVAEGELLGTTVALGDTAPSQVVMFISNS